MNIAIEFGGQEFRSLRKEADLLLARRVSTDYLVVTGEESRRKLVERHAEEFALCEEGMILFGPAAIDLAELLSLPLQSALDNGKIRQNDPVSRQFLGAIVDGLLPLPCTAAACTVVASSAGDAESLDDDLNFLLRLVKLRGYQPQVVSPGLALVLAECGATSYSGIAVKMGATRVDVSVVHQTRELVQFSLPQGGEQIDRQIALNDQSYLRLHDGREVLNVRPIQQWRQGVRNLNQVNCPRSLELRQQYGALLQSLLLRLREELTPSVLRKLLDQLPLIVGGSLAAPLGMESLLRQTLQEVPLPVKLHSISRVQDVTFSALRGGLIAGEVLPLRRSQFAA